MGVYHAAGVFARIKMNSSCISHSYDTFIDSSKASSPQSTIFYLRIKSPVSLRLLKVIQWLLTSSSSSSRHFCLSFIVCFLRGFVRRMWQIQLAFFLFIVCRIYLSSCTLCNTSSFLNDRSNWSTPSFCSTTFQIFFYLFFEVSEFHHHTMLCSKCSTSLVSSVNLSSVCWWNESYSRWLLLWLWQSWI